MTNNLTDSTICLAITHNLFLTNNQRQAIAMGDDTHLKIRGVSLPVWTRFNKSNPDNHADTDGPAEEIFCYYYLDNVNSEELITPVEDGYNLHIFNLQHRTDLLDPSQKGMASLNVTYHSFITVNNVDIKVIHFININDIEVFNESLTHKDKVLLATA